MSDSIFFVLISPYMDSIKICEGDSVQNALRSFRSSVWKQGSGADERVNEEYGGWGVYEWQERNLIYLATFAEFDYGM
jgi:hypothetical protein